MQIQSEPYPGYTSYEVEFCGGDLKELASNIIAESMYAQCDVDRNEYLLLEPFVDHRKDDSAFTVEDQKVMVNGREISIK